MSADLKACAIEFLQGAAAGHVEKAFELVAPDFCHHNPYYCSDAAALKTAMQENALNHPDKLFEVQRVIAEGAWVFVHSRIFMPSKGLSIAAAHIFRFDENCKLRELWDIGQVQPEQMINQLGMF